MSMLLTKLKTIAESNLGKPVQDCVISVCVYSIFQNFRSELLTLFRRSFLVVALHLYTK